MSVDQEFVPVVRRFRQLAFITLAIGLTLLAISCGGSSSAISGPGPDPTPQTATQVKIGDAPADRVVSFEVSAGPITATPTSGNAVTVLSGTRRLELSHLSGTNEPLPLLNVPQGSYSSASITVYW
jgi:hypothetical protein